MEIIYQTICAIYKVGFGTNKPTSLDIKDAIYCAYKSHIITHQEYLDLINYIG